MTFGLAASLHGHSQDVKSVSPLNSQSLLSGSRDGSAIVWTDNAIQFTLSANSSFVNAVSSCGKCEKYPNGAFATAGADKIIRVYDLRNPLEPELLLIGHDDNICDIKFFESGKIVSASWDKTAKVWIDGTCKYTLAGHEFAVWSVLPIDENTVFTASADKTIRKWSNSKCIKTITGHSDVVRSLALYPRVGFVSCSNDASVRLWTFEGECIQQLDGHTSFVYQVSVAPNGDIASCGEDRTARVWRDGKCIDTIVHPCTSVWSVCWISNDELATGASDGTVRLFSSNPSKQLPSDQIKEYEAQVASYAMSSQQVKVDPSQLSSADELQVPGTRDQQVKMVKKDQVIEAYQWSASQNKWIQIGQVVDAVGSNRKQTYQGVEYDYVFDIDVYEGSPPLKLCYNVSQNPWQTAQDFIHKNELPQEFLDQIANFIIRNTSGAEIQQKVSQNVDPFTGSTRHVPAAAVSNVIPMTEFTLFKQVNFQGIKKKLLEFNQTNEQLSLLQLETLSKSLDSMENQTEIQDLDQFFEIVLTILTSWNSESLFPAIDIVRMLFLDTKTCNKTWLKVSNLIEGLLQGSHVNQTLLYRGLSNLVANSVKLPPVLPFLKSLNSTNKNTRNAYITLCCNITVLLNQGDAFNPIVTAEMLNLLYRFIKEEKDSENMYRALVTCGTLVKKNQKAKLNSHVIGLSDFLLKLQLSTEKERLVLRQVQDLLQ